MSHVFHIIQNSFYLTTELRKKPLRPLFFENLFNEPADSRFPKIRIKIKMGFCGFLFELIRNSSPHFILCDAFANGGQWTW